MYMFVYYKVSSHIIIIELFEIVQKNWTLIMLLCFDNIL